MGPVKNKLAKNWPMHCLSSRAVIYLYTSHEAPVNFDTKLLLARCAASFAFEGFPKESRFSVKIHGWRKAPQLSLRMLLAGETSDRQTWKQLLSMSLEATSIPMSSSSPARSPMEAPLISAIRFLAIWMLLALQSEKSRWYEWPAKDFSEILFDVKNAFPRCYQPNAHPKIS